MLDRIKTIQAQVAFELLGFEVQLLNRFGRVKF